MKKNIDEFVKNVEDNSNDILEDTLLDKEASLEDTRGFSYEDIVKISTKDKVSKLPWLIAIFLILIISLTVGYRFFRYNPQTIFISAADKFFTFITDRISENSYDIAKGKLYVDYSSGTDNFTTNIKYTLDGANNLSKLNLDGKVDIYSDGKFIYISDKELFDGYLRFTSSSSLDKIKLTDIKTTITGINQAFDKVSTSEKITGGKINYDLGNKTIKVYESKLLIDKNNYERSVDTFINSLKTNEEFMNSVSKILEGEAKGKLDKLSLKLKNHLKDNSLEIKIYTKMNNGEFIKCEIKDKSGVIVLNNKDSFDISLDTDYLRGIINVIAKDKLDIKFDLSNFGKGKMILEVGEANSFGKINEGKAIDYSSLSNEEKELIDSKILENEYYNKYIKIIKR